MERKQSELVHAKMADEGAGGFSGYASTWNNVDYAGEIVTKGAFADCLARFKAEGFIAVQHEYSDLPVATVKDAYEDAKGLFIDCEFHSTDEAQKARTYMRERMERGKSVGLSIGYNIRREDMERTKEGTLLKRIDLWEVSIVTKPCNPLATATAAKSDEPGAKGEYLGDYAEASAALSAMYSLCDRLRWNCFSIYLFDEEITPEERESHFTGALSEFSALVMRFLRAYHAAEPEAQADMADEVKSLFPIPGDLAEPPMARAYSARLDALLTEITDATDRAKQIAALRESQGRSLVSPERREQLLSVHKALAAFLEETAPLPSFDADVFRIKANARRRRLLAGAIGDSEYESQAQRA